MYAGSTGYIPGKAAPGPVTCVYCVADLPAGARYCTNCGKFQREWRNWVADLGNVASVLALSGALFLFVWQQGKLAYESYAADHRQQDIDSSQLLGSLLNQFTQASASLEHIMTAYGEATTESYTQVLSSAVMAREVLLTSKEGDCQVGSTRCRLVLVDRSRNEVESFPPENPAQNIIELMRQLRNYSEALGTIVSSETAAQMRAGLAAVNEAIVAIARTSAVAVPDLATPGIDVNGTEFGKTKWQLLRAMTARANPIIKETTQNLAAATLFASDVPKISYANSFSEAIEELRENPNADALDRVLEARSKYDALLLAHPEEVLTQWSDAHALLSDRLQVNGSFQDVFDRLSELREATQSLEQTFSEAGADIAPSKKENRSK